MNIKYFLALMLLGSVVAVNAEGERTCNLGCQCYCSDLCGPRESKDDDCPFFDEEHGQCFCKQRDKDNYVPNDCAHKHKPEEVAKINCCKKDVSAPAAEKPAEAAATTSFLF